VGVAIDLSNNTAFSMLSLSLLWDVLIAVKFLRVGFRGQVAT